LISILQKKTISNFRVTLKEIKTNEVQLFSKTKGDTVTLTHISNFLRLNYLKKNKTNTLRILYVI